MYYTTFLTVKKIYFPSAGAAAAGIEQAVSDRSRRNRQERAGRGGPCPAIRNEESLEQTPIGRCWQTCASVVVLHR